MSKAGRLFSSAERKRINKAITEAEKMTSGEIVPVVATASGRYDRAEDLFGLVVAVVGVALAWMLIQDVQPAGDDWESGQMIRLGWLPIAVITIVGFIAGAVAATLFPVLKLPFVSKGEISEEVERSASEAFHRFRLRGTAGATGVLIYISLFEHKVRILGDMTISERLGQKDWDEICRLVVEGVRAGQHTDGLCDGIAKAGELLAEHFPSKAGDGSGLVNELQFMD